MCFIIQVALEHTHTWKFQNESEIIAIDTSLDDFLLLRQCKASKGSIQVLNRLTGEIIYKVASQCDHKTCDIRGHPRDKNCILESCTKCAVIRAYDVKMETCKTVSTDREEITIMWTGPSGSLLAMDTVYQCLQFDWNHEDETLRLVHDRGVRENVVVENDRPLNPIRFCYIEKNDFLVVTSKKNAEPWDVRAMKLTDICRGIVYVRWKLSGVVKPHALACDSDVNLYISDIETNNIFVIDGSNGNPIKVLLPQDGIGTIHHIRWCRSQPHLTVYHGDGDDDAISCFNVQ